MTKREIPELKPCPFCGGNDIRQEYGAGSKPPYNDPYVVCVDCGASVEGKSGAWNRRANLPPTMAEAMRCPEVMALVDALHYYADFHENPNDGPWGLVSDDYGKVAREALIKLHSKNGYTDD